jgi:hypothetical protein
MRTHLIRECRTPAGAPSRPEARLRGVHYDRGDLAQVLGAVDVRNYLGEVSPEAFLALLVD